MLNMPCLGLVPMNKTRTILGASFAAVFVFAMMTNPVFAVSPNLSIASADGYDLTVAGKSPGHGVKGHLIVVYAFFTDAQAPGVGQENSFIAEVAAYHPQFDDDSEQSPAKPVLHAHELYLDKGTLCVTGLDVAADPTVTVSGSTVSVPQSNGGDVTAHVIAGYDFTDDGLCPTEVFDLQPVV